MNHWGLRFTALMLVAVVALVPGCSKKANDAPRAPAHTVEVEGLHHLVGRAVASSDARLLVAGYSGEQLHGRFIWAQADGDVISDQNVPEVVRPTQVAACVDGEIGQVMFSAGVEGEAPRARRVAITAGGDATREWVPLPEGAQLSAVDGAMCGLCLYDPAGALSCQTSSDSPDPTTWQTGELATWSVLQSGDDLILIDWGVDDDRWITLRMAVLPVEAGAEFAWTRAHIIGQRPEVGVADTETHVNPRFVATDDGLTVTFVDSSQYFARIYIQDFPKTGEPSEPLRVDDCNRTCELRWFGETDDVFWVWYNAGVTDVAVRIEPSAITWEQFLFDAPGAAHPIANGLFKMGMGDRLGNWWAIFSQEE